MNAPDVSIGDGSAEVLSAAVALRWSRPDLTRVLAEHLKEQADALGDRDAWLVAAGWQVHAIHCVGDGRESAAESLEQLGRWDGDVLHSAAAGRLRVALAAVAHDAGEGGAAELLLADVTTGVDRELEADRCAVLARLATSDGGAARSAAEAAWAGMPECRAGIGVAELLLLSAVSERREGRPEQAISRAVTGLTRLDRARGAAGAPTPAGHLAAALAAEWIASLVDAQRWDQAEDVIAGLAARLGEPTRPTRQLAYLRSTIARVLAAGAGSDAAEELDRAARDAAAADVPDLEHVCRVALGELHEAQGHVGAAVESVRLAVLAQRRHRARSARLRAALATITESAVVAPPAVARQPDASTGGPGAAAGVHVDEPDPAQRTAVLTAVTAGAAGAVGPWATGSWGRRDGAGPRERADRSRPSRHRRADPSADRPAGSGLDGPDPDAPAAGGDRAVTPEPQRTADRRAGAAWAGRSSRDDLLRPGGRARLTPVPDPSTDEPTASGAASAVDVDGVEDPWLAAALAELDRIWRAPLGESAGDRGTAESSAAESSAAESSAAESSAGGETTAGAAGCVVVLDLTDDSGEPAGAAAEATMRAVAIRVAGHLPAGARMREDSPESRAVVMPGSDRAAASAWMRGVVPGLAEGLVVDGTAAGTLLRASVHGTDGVAGAQMLQRLGGGTVPASTTRTSRFLTPRSAPDSAGTHGAGTHGAGTHGAGTHGAGTALADTSRAEWMRGRSARLSALGIGRPASTVPPVGGVEATEAGETGSAGSMSASEAVADVSSPADPGGRPLLSRAADPGGGSARRPYLPDGVVVRPGSGGRRHRRDEVTENAPTTSRSPRGRRHGDGTQVGEGDGPSVPVDGPPAGNGSGDIPERAGLGSAPSARAEKTSRVGADSGTSAASRVTPSGTTGSAAAAPGTGPSAPPRPDRDREQPPVDGLGLADLLAGALAEYRRI